MTARCDAQLTIPVASAIVAGRFQALSRPSKMPGFAWDIPTAYCRRGAVLSRDPQTVCANCYAKTGRHNCEGPRKTQEARLEGLAHPQWVDAMEYLIASFDSCGFFRWFSCGDLQSVAHLSRIVEVCRRTPGIRHWLPTHEPFLVGEWLEAHKRVPGNLCIRISADYIESAPTTPTWGLPTSTVHRFAGEPVPIPGLPRKASVECRAYERAKDGRHGCGRCRACWDPRVRNVSYRMHW